MMRSAGSTAVASIITLPVPERTMLDRWTMCQEFAAPSAVKYWHMGDTTIRFFRLTPRTVIGENNTII